MKAIVTGGAGFIGSHLCRRLLKEGWSVLAVDNLSSGYLHNVPTGAKFQWMDLTQEDAIDQLPTEPVDVVFHLASHVGQELSFERPVYDFKANAFSTLLLLKWSMRHKINQFIFASSMNVYGDPPIVPVLETTLVQPPSPYAVGKIASEYLCSVYQNFGVNTTSLRLFNVYGPMQDMQNMKQGMVSIFMSYVARGEPIWVRGSKDRFRDFISVHDVVDAFYRCVDKRAYGKIYNVCTGKKTYVWQLLEGIIKAYGFNPSQYPVNYGESTPRDQFGVFGCAAALQADLGWMPQVELSDGLAEMVRWVKEEAKL